MQLSPLDAASGSLLKDLIRNVRALWIAVRSYQESGGAGEAEARAEVRDMYQETSSAARALLLSVLASWRPGGKSKSLGEVDRRFERCSVACRDLLSAVLSVLRR